MAMFNSTENHAVAGPAAFHLGLFTIPELEKISCSFRGEGGLHPLALMGKRIRNAQIVHGFNAGDDSLVLGSSIVESTVLAVTLGSIEHAIETSLLLQDADGGHPYYMDITNLTVLEVLS